MFSYLFHLLFYNPLYNALVGLVDVVPYADVGIAVVLLTIFVKLLLFPLSIRMIRTQIQMREIEPELARLKDKHKKDKQAQAQAVLALYREKGVRPFSSFLLFLIQFPILIALYLVFLRGGLPSVNVEILYSFVPVPDSANMHFLGIVDMASKSIPLALLAGITQYLQLRLSLPPLAARKEGATMQEDFARSFQFQMRYFLPFFVAGIAYFFSAAIALYWLTGNVFAIGQELFVRHGLKLRSAPVAPEVKSNP